MKIVVKESTMVKPAEVTPGVNLWISNLDLAIAPIHLPVLCIYRANGAAKFFDFNVITDALSRVLVLFYPAGGRLNIGEDGRININCQGQGVLFVKAESDGVLDDLGDFSPTSSVHEFVPTVDYSQAIESYPLMVSQVTYFKCGGVSLGLGLHHYVADAISWAHFIKSWSEMARGLELSLPPYIDRTLLRARDPPKPVFEHVGYKHPPTTMNSSPSTEPVVASIFKLSREQLDVLKLKSKEDGHDIIKFTSFELLAAHIWKCICRTRGLANDEETKIYIATDYRGYIQPSLPPGYFGNVILMNAPVTTAGKIKSSPNGYAVSIVYNELVKAKNNNYLMSTLDHLELQHDLFALAPNLAETLKCSNLSITSWAGFSDHNIDFGWGHPIFIGPCGIGVEGLAFVLPNMIKDKSVSFVISLQPEHMKLFSNFFYEIFNMNSEMPSKL